MSSNRNSPSPTPGPRSTRGSILVAVVLGAGIALGVTGAAAIERYVMPDGKVIYSDKPVPGAKSVRTLDPPPTPAVSPGTAGADNQRNSAPPAVLSPPGGAAKPSGGGSKPTTLDAAEAEIRAASTALEDAKRRLDEGREPQPGERIGTASGRSRLTQDYANRIKSLEDQMNNAQERLDRAYRQRNELR